LGIEKNILSYGVVISVNGPVVSLQGFLMAFVNELFRLAVIPWLSRGYPIGRPDTAPYGLVVNLYRDETMNLLIGALLLNPEIRLSEGAKVTAMSRLASIILGDFAIGSILDGWGGFILNSGRVDAQSPWLLESPASGIIDRQSVFEPLQTGIVSVDSMIPLGRGQRELVVGDRQTGKTSIGLDTKSKV
jgi:F-type H+-transporting ATPase subunit alpha